LTFIVNNAKPDSNGYNNTDWLQQNMVETIALGNPPLAIHILNSMPQQKRDDEIPNIVSELVKPNPDEAVAMFQQLDPEKDANTATWDYNRAACMVLPIIYKSDPQQALTLADSINDPGTQAEALTVVADLMPIAQAIPLYREAETKSTDQPDNGFSPACISAHAWVRDKILGAQLFKEAFDKVIGAPATDQFVQEPPYAEFAFYYARIDPAFSRLLLEKRFADDQRNTSPYDQGGIATDVAAMTAIDIDRAQAMEYSMKDADDRFEAGVKIAQYRIATPSVRDTIDFDSWNSGQDLIPNSLADWR
jgi:hypothetical protein